MDYSTLYKFFIYFSIFVIGVIIGRISMAVQYALMKPQPNEKDTEDKQQYKKETKWNDEKLDKISKLSKNKKEEFRPEKIYYESIKKIK
ncbi:MAG: hypothetical protein N3D84_00485 [Candidatus Woesearchaeota archaeon]|nr:hypothetical protein [Candidatus Woesearchaeota archaeon]